VEFEWHDNKAEANLQAHGVSFELATTVFHDPFAIERLDDREKRTFCHCRYGRGTRSVACRLRRARGTHPTHFSPQGDAV